MAKKTKDFDAVQRMREARDKISRDIQGMSFEEQKAYFRKHARRARERLESVGKDGAV